MQELASKWLVVKAQIDLLQADLDEISKQLVTALGAKPEGSQTHKDGPFAVTITGRMNYSCSDLAALAGMAPALVKPALNDTEVKKLRAADPVQYARIAELLTVKPGKTGVAIKLMEVEL